MKKFIILFLFTFIILNSNIMALAISNKRVTIDNITYEFEDSSKTASLIDFHDYNAKSVTIPSKVNGYTITKIETRAFGKPKFKNLASVVLPDSVQEIGDKAFSLCFNLEYIKLPARLRTIGNGCFSFCSVLSNIHIPDTVSYIGKEAFFSCVSLKNINIPTSLKILKSRTFRHCISLNKIYIHKNIEKIYSDVFDECRTNLCLADTIVDSQNVFYKKSGNSIVNKKDGKVVICFPVNDAKYKEKSACANFLYKKMQDFLKNYNSYSEKDFNTAFLNFLNTCCGTPKILAKYEFKKQCKNKLVLYRGTTKKEYADELKAAIPFFSDNLKNERGNGIYTTTNSDHANAWIWPENADTSILKPFEHDNDLYLKMAYKLIPHGEVITMFLDGKAKVLNNSVLRDLKDMIYKMHPKTFKIASSLLDAPVLPKSCDDLKIFKSKEELLFHNSGVLTRLLGYDVLYEKEYNLVLDKANKEEDRREFLIVNPAVLNILGDD